MSLRRAYEDARLHGEGAAADRRAAQRKRQPVEACRGRRVHAQPAPVARARRGDLARVRAAAEGHAQRRGGVQRGVQAPGASGGGRGGSGPS